LKIAVLSTGKQTCSATLNAQQQLPYGVPPLKYAPCMLTRRRPGRKNIVICEDEVEERDRLLEKVDQIAQRSEAILRSDNCKRNIGRGRRKDASLDRLVNGLIRTWRVAGGRVGGGTSGNEAGPLIRFLKHATALVLPGEPSNETVRHWVRSYKRSRGGNKSP
jgi:hypothetical protein